MGGQFILQSLRYFCLTFPSQERSVWLVQLEAMCCKKPVISTELGTGTSFVNISKKPESQSEPNDVGSLSEAINYLIDNPKKEFNFGEYGYTRVRQHFTSEKMVQKAP
jgi:glycosyltransferase involved in cell wall biosynthesis